MLRDEIKEIFARPFSDIDKIMLLEDWAQDKINQLKQQHTKEVEKLQVENTALRTAANSLKNHLPKRGKWLKVKAYGIDCVKCSICDEGWVALMADNFNYCPNCSSENREVKHGR